MNEDKKFQDYVMLEPVINQVYIGRTEDHTCPFCKKAELNCTIDDFEIKIECPNCRKYFEGILSA